jgi:hypothetical protein
MRKAGHPIAMSRIGAGDARLWTTVRAGIVPTADATRWWKRSAAGTLSESEACAAGVGVDTIPLNAAVLMPVRIALAERWVIDPQFLAACGVRPAIVVRIYDAVLGALPGAV